MATDERTSMVDANGHAWVRLDTARARSGRTWILGINSGARLESTEVPQIQFIDFVVVEAELEYIIMRQSTEAFGILSVPLARSRSSHLENGALSFCSLFLAAFSRCLGAAC